ncbi:MAG: OmpA family protein, partial [Flavobacterium sp.]|nr:OmpA family protein [Flavobacterium sp.]
NQNLMETSKEMAVLSAKGAQNIEKALESIKEKDLKIGRMQDALTRKDSVTLAVVTSLKSAVGLSDPDIEINVEKGVVFISIADKLLFKSGSYEVTDKAKGVLAKVAKVINDKPDFECMVEGHTDNVPFTGSGILLDNWDLSVKRSTSIVRVLTSQLGVKPSQLIAAGRSSYVPLVENNSAENKARNRRTRIVVLPKIDQFYEMVEKEMKKQPK